MTHENSVPFVIDRTYRRRFILSACSRFWRTKSGWMALVKPKDGRFVDVVYEFVQQGQSNKFKCFGVGRADCCTLPEIAESVS
jgi:hypothetical protein